MSGLRPGPAPEPVTDARTGSDGAASTDPTGQASYHVPAPAARATAPAAAVPRAAAPAPAVPQAAAPASHVAQGGRRRIDRLLSEGYLAGLEALPLGELRSRRQEAEQEKADLAYRCALVQGREAIVRAEVERRAAGRPAHDLLSRLPDLLAGGSGAAVARVTDVRWERRSPDLLDQARRLEDGLLADTGLAQLQVCPAEDARALLGTLEELSAVLAGRYRRVDKVLDLLSRELTRRYRVGQVPLDDLLRPLLAPTPR